MSSSPALAAASPRIGTPSRVRIVSYNVLSSALARPSHFTRANPDHLEFDRRLPLVLAKLEDAMNRNSLGVGGMAVDRSPPPLSPPSPPPTIFALQEVCYPFASALHNFFAQRGYHFVTGLYGRPFNGYMGIGIAYPLKYFETMNVDICRLSDERPGGWPREGVHEDSGNKASLGEFVKKISVAMGKLAVQTFRTINSHVTKRLGYTIERAEIDPWQMSERRFNVLLTVVLRPRAGDPSNAFSVSNYHMPCAFYAPAVMNVHAEMAARRVQDLAYESRKSIRNDEGSGKSKAVPYIFAGDFNILPNSAHYSLLTTGKLDRSDPTYPPPKHGVEWKVGSLPMDSAYALYDSEPEFTNYAHLKEDSDPFIGTLDYIFLSRREFTECDDQGNASRDQWKVLGVQKLPCRDESGGPFPNEEEPSDHYLIGADLELVTA